MFEFYSAVTSLNGGDMLGLCAFCTLFLRDIEAVDLPFSLLLLLLRAEW